jgi:hypothetical protein
LRRRRQDRIRPGSLLPEGPSQPGSKPLSSAQPDFDGTAAGFAVGAPAADEGERKDAARVDSGGISKYGVIFPRRVPRDNKRGEYKQKICRFNFRRMGGRGGFAAPPLRRAVFGGGRRGRRRFATSYLERNEK